MGEKGQAGSFLSNEQKWSVGRRNFTICYGIAFLEAYFVNSATINMGVQSHNSQEVGET